MALNLLHDHDSADHICMWEGPSFFPTALQTQNEALKAVNQSSKEELQRLRSLLDKNNIVWAKPVAPAPKKTFYHQTTILRWTRGCEARYRKDQKRVLPHLPNEILVRILGHVVTSAYPIIDPFWKLRTENLTKEEKKNSAINVDFLATCKAFKTEGTRLLIANNALVFTQIAALENFGMLPANLRSTIRNLTLRVVGKYYDDTAYKRVVSGQSIYHADIPNQIVHVEARPEGITKDKGIQAYCWQHVVDFLQVLAIRDLNTNSYSSLFPSIQYMRLDLVNFCEHLPFVGSPFISVLRWHLGKILDELVITGAPDDEFSNNEERLLPGILKDEGVFASSGPVFISMRNYLQPLPSYGLNLHLVRGSLSERDEIPELPPIVHPEGGSPPTSKHPGANTLWKYVVDNLNRPKKKWIEFHRRCGYPASICGDLVSDSDNDDEIPDLDDMDEDNSDDEDDSDEEEDSDGEENSDEEDDEDEWDDETLPSLL